MNKSNRSVGSQGENMEDVALKIGAIKQLEQIVTVQKVWSWIEYVTDVKILREIASESLKGNHMLINAVYEKYKEPIDKLNRAERELMREEVMSEDLNDED